MKLPLKKEGFMDKLEKLINTIMKEAEADGEPVTREEAEEMAKMELASKENRRYEKAETAKERKPRERKTDETKLKILTAIKEVLERIGGFAITLKTETELNFNFNNESYTIKLIKHRKNKIAGVSPNGMAPNF